METDEARSLRPTDSVEFSIIDDEAVLLDLVSQEFIGLNGVATAMWKSLSEGATIRETATALEEMYDVSPEVLCGHLNAFVQNMVERGLLEFQ